MYENTDARTHRVAAELIESGVDVNGIYQAALRARSRGEAEADRPGAGPHRPAPRRRPCRSTYLSAEDYAATGADETLTEGIIDFVRGDRGHLRRRGRPRQARQPARGAQGEPALHRRLRRRLRRSPAAMGGGGHRRAAGFSTDRSYDELVEFLSDEIARRACLTSPHRRRSRRGRDSSAATSPPGSPPTTSSPAIGASSAEDRPRRHAGPVRHGPAGRPARPAPRALQRYVLGLPKTYVATARLGWTSRRPAIPTASSPRPAAYPPPPI